MKVRGRSKTDKFTFDCEEGERILFAGLRNGLALPYECATGTCGTCKARVRDPATIKNLWSEAPGNAYLKPERGEFLMCQTCALADCEIAVPANMENGRSDSQPPKARMTPEGRLLQAASIPARTTVVEYAFT